jgi:carboxylate-amine ligase
MNVNFGSSPPFSLGIEEEFQLLNADSYELTSRFDEVFVASGSDERVKPELMKSVVEVASHVAGRVEEAVGELASLRARLRDGAAEQGSLIAAAGTHPFSRYRHQEISEGERYETIVEKMQWIAERELIFGLHVHVGLPTADTAIAVANGLRTWLPELLALSANSPFWQGRDTGLASTRIKVFDPFPRSGLPPAFASWEEYELLVERGVRTNSFPDYTFIWWDLRPHPRLGTIEVRICDAQTRLESVGAVAALVQSLAATLAERYERDGHVAIQPRTLVEENKWRATRYGLETNLIDLERDEERPARDAVLALVELARPAARRLGCETELDEVESICDRGTGASEQREVHEREGGLLAVARRLAEQTVRGL